MLQCWSAGTTNDPLKPYVSRETGGGRGRGLWELSRLPAPFSSKCETALRRSYWRQAESRVRVGCISGSAGVPGQVLQCLKDVRKSKRYPCRAAISTQLNCVLAQRLHEGVLIFRNREAGKGGGRPQKGRAVAGSPTEPGTLHCIQQVAKKKRDIQATVLSAGGQWGPLPNSAQLGLGITQKIPEGTHVGKPASTPEHSLS